MIFEWLTPTDSRWRRYTAAWESDIYHLPAYAVAAGEPTDDVRAAHVWEGERQLLVPLVIRDIRGGADLDVVLDASSPYGYPGPILSPMRSSERGAFLREALPQARRGLSDAGYFRVRANAPLVGLRSVKWSFGTTVLHGDTVSIDLTLSEEDSGRTRARAIGMKSIGLGNGDTARFTMLSWQYFDAFLDIYTETMGVSGRLIPTFSAETTFLRFASFSVNFLIFGL